MKKKRKSKPQLCKLKLLVKLNINWYMLEVVIVTYGYGSIDGGTRYLSGLNKWMTSLSKLSLMIMSNGRTGPQQLRVQQSVSSLAFSRKTKRQPWLLIRTKRIRFIHWQRISIWRELRMLVRLGKLCHAAVNFINIYACVFCTNVVSAQLLLRTCN